MVRAAVTVVEVAIVTLFTRFLHAVAAAWGDGIVDASYRGIAAIVGTKILVVAVGRSWSRLAATTAAYITDSARIVVIASHRVVDRSAPDIWVAPVVGAEILVVAVG